MMAGWLIVLIVLAAIVGGILVALTIVTIVRAEANERAEVPKVKRSGEDSGFNPFPPRLTDGEPSWAEDDGGDLPELSEDDVYLEDKPKRLG